MFPSIAMNQCLLFNANETNFNRPTLSRSREIPFINFLNEYMTLFVLPSTQVSVSIASAATSFRRSVHSLVRSTVTIVDINWSFEQKSQYLAFSCSTGFNNSTASIVLHARTARPYLSACLPFERMAYARVRSCLLLLCMPPPNNFVCCNPNSLTFFRRIFTIRHVFSRGCSRKFLSGFTRVC